MTMELVCSEVARAVGGVLMSGSGETAVKGVSIDTREISGGELFVALKGQLTDGHLFVEEAFRKGAAAAIVEREVRGGGTLIRVENTLEALGDLASHYRQKHPVRTVGITGSTGKTTTKDLIASVLSTRYRALKSEGNYNTEIGLPLTLLRLSPGHEVCVLEMAMRGRGQIAKLARIASPDIGVITNIGPAHAELLGSLEEIARAKAELLEALPEEGVAVLNSDDDMVRALAALARCRIVHYGRRPGSAVSAEDITGLGADGTRFLLTTSAGSIRVGLPVPGEHNVSNALAAAAVGLELGLSLEEIRLGLENPRLSGMRLELRRDGGLLVLNDCYNANPLSMRAALDTLSSLRAYRRIAVLGTMLELGRYARDSHLGLGRHAAGLGVDILVTVGEGARGIARGALEAGMDPARVKSFGTNGEAIDYLEKAVAPGDAVLVKGSRAMEMEQIVHALLRLAKGDTV